MKASASFFRPLQHRGAKRVLRAGVLVAVLDAAFAVLVFVVLRDTITIVQFFQLVASGLLGSAAFTGGLPAAMLGMVLHVVIACAWAAVFFAASGRSPTLQRLLRAKRGPLKVGAAFGVLVWLVMDLVVLPLSGATPTPVFSGRFAVMLTWHAVGVGWPIALIVRPSTVYRRPSLNRNVTEAV